MTIARDFVQDGGGVPEVRKSYGRIPDILPVPNLVQIQLDSYHWFREQALRELFDEISPIQDFSGNRMDLYFKDYYFGTPKYSEYESREREMTYSAPLRVRVQLVLKETGEVKEQEIFMGDFPLMTSKGTFIINGAERVVVSQLVRSPGVYFTLERDATSGRDLCFAKLIPSRGAWLEFETSNRDVISVKVDRKRKVPITVLLRAIDQDDEITAETQLGTDERLWVQFQDLEDAAEHKFFRSTLERETAKGPLKNKEEALLEFYHRLRPGDPPSLDNARNLIQSLFFNPRRYDLGRVGRYKVNRRLGLDLPQTQRTLTQKDIVAIVRQIMLINEGYDHADDIDHLGNRRVRTVGELIQNQFRIGLLRMERVVRERMTIIPDPEGATPSALINVRPVVAAIKEFFGGSQLSQFMDQTNPLAELTHKRRLSALGPGGLSRDRAGFDVRDVHHSHYGRICPIETPEGPNIGLIGSLATYGRVNEYGFIETPYRRVINELPNDSTDLAGRVLRQDATDAKGKAIVSSGTTVTSDVGKKLAKLPATLLPIQPYVSDKVEYLPADEEEKYVVAQANSLLDSANHFIEDKVEARAGSSFVMASPEEIDYIDVSPKQIVSVAASLIPFLEHDDANRALMGANMQRQAVPLVRPEAPLVSTGMERRTAMDSGQVVFAEEDGVVEAADGHEIKGRYDSGREVTYSLIKFLRSNQGTCLNQRPVVVKGQKVTRGEALADGASTDGGELALGQTLLCAFMSWEGYNFEDAVVISEAVVKKDQFTSIHIEKYEIEARDTKLGPEEITRDIPNVGEESLRNLDEEGVIRIGAQVQAGDILVGKITPKGETELTAEEKLLRAIFGEKARDVKDTSLRVPHGERGTVIAVQAYSRSDDVELPAGVNQVVRVYVAQRRKLSVGDKMAGRHGNKGVVSCILPAEDMPRLADGTPIDIVLNPIGVPSRMNIGQVLETHLGWAANSLGFRAITPVFDGASDKVIHDSLARAWFVQRSGSVSSAPNGHHNGHKEQLDLQKAASWLEERGYDARAVFDESREGEAERACLEIWLEEQEEKDVSGLSLLELRNKAEKLIIDRGVAAPVFGKQTLYDGRSGEGFDLPVTVGYIYMLKLVHLVEDKIHARSTGPYSLITQQPLGGKAQFGGQRFGEMEVWALEAYGAAHALQEMLTVKSDDVVGRVKTYEAIVKGEDIQEPGVPESFKVLVKELQSLALSVEVLNEEDEAVTFPEDLGGDAPQLGINLSGFEGEDILSA